MEIMSEVWCSGSGITAVHTFGDERVVVHKVWRAKTRFNGGEYERKVHFEDEFCFMCHKAQLEKQGIWVDN